MAVHGGNVEALTGDDTFRVPLASCSLDSEGWKILVRDQRGPLVIWSDDDGFLPALERAQRGVLKRQVRRFRAAARLRKILKGCGVVVVATGGVCAAAVPFTRWAIGGGVPSISDRIGESVLERLALPSGIAPEVDGALTVVAERLRPTTAPSTRSFRLLLADYSQEHSFGVPPGTAIVTAGLVCAAKNPEVVAAVVARELAHLENHDVSKRLAETVDFHTALDLVRGDLSKLRTRMLDFADSERSPGFTREQETTATQRASVILAPSAVPPDGSIDWSTVRAEACGLIGRVAPP